MAVLEKKNVRFWLMYLVVFPAKTLLQLAYEEPEACSTYLCDAQTPPLILPKEFQSTLCLIKVIPGYDLEHSLG